MATFGLTPTGLVIKRQSDIITEWTASLRTAFGKNFNMSSSTVEGQIVGIATEREALLWELVEALYNSQYADGAEGTSLDNVLALTGAKRLKATFSKGSVIAFGTPGTPIPRLSVISVLGTATSKFNTDADAIIAAAVDDIQSLSFNTIPDLGHFQINIDLLTTANIPFSANAAAVQSAINALSGFADVTVSGSFGSGFIITFSGASGGQAQPLIVISGNTLTTSAVAVVTAVMRTQVGAVPQIAIPVVCQVTGPVVAPAGALTVIESAVGGWSSVSNPLDIVIGSNIETDTQARIRRKSLLGSAGTATLQAIVARVLQVDSVGQVIGFENITSTIDGGGRPGKSFEIVCEAGANQDIFDAIYSKKPAGIESFGTVSGSVIDSNGFSHPISFSRPTDVPIYIVVNLTRNANYPLNGDTLVRNALVEMGNLLGIGENVIVFGTNGLPFALDSIPGIDNFDFFIGIAPAPVTSNNIIIAAKSQARFDTSRVTVGTI